MSDHAPPREDPQNSYLETRIREALQQGRERDAVRFAVTGYHGALKRFLRTRLDSDDEANEVLSELWVIVCQNVRSFRGEGTFLAFAQGIAAHCISAFLREKQQRRARFSADLPEAAAMPRSDTHPYQKSAVRGRLARILDGLSAQEQEVLELHLRQGLTWDEIGKKLALSGAILRRRHSRLLERLRQGIAFGKVGQFFISVFAQKNQRSQDLPSLGTSKPQAGDASFAGRSQLAKDILHKSFTRKWCCSFGGGKVVQMPWLNRSFAWPRCPLHRGWSRNSPVPSKTFGDGVQNPTRGYRESPTYKNGQFLHSIWVLKFGPNVELLLVGSRKFPKLE